MVSLGQVGRYCQRGMHQYIPCRVERRLRKLFAGYCGFVANHSYVKRSERDQQGAQADTEIKAKGHAWKDSSA